MKQLINAVRDVPNAARGKQSILVLLFRALYDSRRRQAERTLLRYRDVIGEAQRAIRRELIAHSAMVDLKPELGSHLDKSRPVA